MNEQDFTQWLREKTDATPIPEQLLPEHITEEINQNPQKTKWYRSPWINVGAACLLACIIGASVWTVSKSKNNTNESVADKTVKGDEFSHEWMEEALDESENTGSMPSLSKSGIQTAESYQQLYHLLDSLVIATTGASFDDFDVGIAENLEADSVQNSLSSKADAVVDRTETTYSDTNAQVEQVAEADIVKTDGAYIYSCYRSSGYACNAVAIASADNGILKPCGVISAESILAGLPDRDFYIEEMYIANHKLILLCQAWSNAQTSAPDLTMGAYCGNGSGTDTYILTYDIRNPQKPELLSSLMQDGCYQSSRLTNGYLYTFSQKWESLPAEYEQYDDYIPHTENVRLTCSDICIPACPDASCYQIMTGMALENPEHFIASKAILSGSGTYYVSENNIYFAQEGWEQGVSTTELLKFHYTEGSITPEGSVTINGYLLNQFAMDEYQGYLRVAATVTPAYSYDIEPVYEDVVWESAAIDTIGIAVDTEGGVNSNSVKTNALYIIDSDMNLVGKIENLAPDERIYSVRFMGDSGYFVTYRETDPLFSVDLSDPANPKVMDALKIPGFSNYLHFYSEDLLFGLGEEINPATGEFMGLKLSMFDISNPYHISELDKTVLSDAYYSTALYNHKALMIEPERNIIGFYTYHYDDTMYESKELYSIYSYIEDSGFQKLFTCNIREEEIFSEYREAYGDDHGNIRGLYIGDYLYLVLGNRICSYSLDTYDKIDTCMIPEHSY